MTQEIIEMARQAGMYRNQHNLASKPVQYRFSYDGTEEALIAFAKLVDDKATAREREAFAAHAVDIARRAVAEEREACAMVCDEQAQNWKNPKYHYAEASANHCAKAIRARGDQ